MHTSSKKPFKYALDINIEKNVVSKNRGGNKNLYLFLILCFDIIKALIIQF